MSYYDIILMGFIIYGMIVMLMMHVLGGKVISLLRVIDEEFTVIDSLDLDDEELVKQIDKYKESDMVLDVVKFAPVYNFCSFMVTSLPIFLVIEISIFTYSDIIFEYDTFIYYATTTSLSILNAFLIVHGINFKNNIGIIKRRISVHTLTLEMLTFTSSVKDQLTTTNGDDINDF